ncbi:MAG TPA: hypothetical protein VGO68_10680 [Pyrinomonadaceae bacterium]|jgi:hypothetical protein|nr:hypothetical protein [Pyrinomonadaceae bacterium]
MFNSKRSIWTRLITLSILIVGLGICAMPGQTADSTFIECDTTARNCGAACVLADYNFPGTYSICVSNCSETFNGCVQDLPEPPPIELVDWCESKASGLYSTCNQNPATLGTNTPNGLAYSACITNGGTQSGCCNTIASARRDACMPEE